MRWCSDAIYNRAVREEAMKAFRVLFIGALLLAAPNFARAQTSDFPNHPVKLVVGFGAGGSTDVAARIMAQKMSEKSSAKAFWSRTAPAPADCSPRKM